MKETTKRILVVDDDPQITEVLRVSFIAHGYEVRFADDGSSALEITAHWQPDLIITDLSMPKMGGIAFCQAVRGFSNVPIIVLSVKGKETTKVEALESGADDYVTKPFGMKELLARAAAALRRASALSPRMASIEQGDFVLDIAAHRAEIRGKEVYLTPKEFDLLTFLLRNAGKVLTHKSLLAALWGRTYTDQPDSIRVLVRHLRKKIETNPAAPKYLRTEPWIGYRFEPTC
jgi:two-component system, OmpR family, KDP operon response regulator KdpE